MMAYLNDISGLAALSICESLLLALGEHDVLTKGQIAALLHRAERAVAGQTDLDRAELRQTLQRVGTWPKKSR